MSMLSRSAYNRSPLPSPKGDNDRVLVLTLAVILVQNHAPLELILALLYIAM